MRWNVIAIQLQQFRSVFRKKIGDIIRSVPFALSSYSALIFNIVILSKIQNDLKKRNLQLLCNMKHNDYQGRFEWFAGPLA